MMERFSALKPVLSRFNNEIATRDQKKAFNFDAISAHEWELIKNGSAGLRAFHEATLQVCDCLPYQTVFCLCTMLAKGIQHAKMS